LVTECPYIILPLASGWAAVMDGFPVAARRAPEIGFDAAYVSSWLQQCDQSHDHYCQPTRFEGGASSGLQLRLVDVTMQCLISSTSFSAFRYAALSYVWGQVDQPVLKKELVAAWKTPRAFSSIRLPKTIKDAMAAC